MAPKRPSDADEFVADASVKENAPPPAKKARTSEEGTSKATTSKAKKAAAAPAESKNWKDVELEEEAEGESIPVYDDCAEIRRKIRLLQKEPGFKITHWLKEIGNINSNSYGRFMKAKARNDGAENGTYYAAYVYFEKVRIAEGKKKTATRKSNEATMPFGFPLERARGGWVIGPR